MPIYTIRAMVEIEAETQHEAYGYLRHALEHAKKAEIVHLDSEVISERENDRPTESETL